MRPGESIQAAAMMQADELSLTGQDGGSPTTLAAGSAPGETGVSIAAMRFKGRRISARCLGSI